MLRRINQDLRNNFRINNHAQIFHIAQTFTYLIFDTNKIQLVMRQLFDLREAYDYGYGLLYLIKHGYITTRMRISSGNKYFIKYNGYNYSIISKISDYYWLSYCSVSDIMNNNEHRFLCHINISSHLRYFIID